ncbi:hypothetical protein FGIG_02371 [Fasciola gigantica]|uniref:F-actin-capping protein subunit alpha n=1 Tax=Fasciola gigantica TaxID=46835 RepID=A0A504YCW2_FASGI|nr:hypothetical protein FGIG_02371 [Fasciola gigantica]
MVDECVTPEDRACVCARLALLAPPCEFSEVLDDIRAICSENPSVQQKLVAAAAQYNRDQMISVLLPNSLHSSLISVHGDLGGDISCAPDIMFLFISITSYQKSRVIRYYSRTQRCRWR